MNLLENELVRKYFNCDSCRETTGQSDWHIAFKILESMQQPIKAGNKVLRLGGCAMDEPEAIEIIADHDIELFHALWLRLPDAFQTGETASQRCGCGLTWSTIHRFDGPCHVLDNQLSPEKCRLDEGAPCICPQPSGAVEKKIQEMRVIHPYKNSDVFEKALRELVALARK